MEIGEFETAEDPFYTTYEKDIHFVPNSADGPGAYDVIIKGKDYFYLPDRTLPDLINPGVSTKSMMGCLEAMCGRQIGLMLSENNITPERLQIELARLRIKELEQEVQLAYSAGFDLEKA